MVKMVRAQRIPGIHGYDPDQLKNMVGLDVQKRFKDDGRLANYFASFKSIAEYACGELAIRSQGPQQAPQQSNVPFWSRPAQQQGSEKRTKLMELLRNMYTEFSGTDGKKRVVDYSTYYGKPVVISQNATPLVVTDFVFYGANLDSNHRALLINPLAPERKIDRTVVNVGKYLHEYNPSQEKFEERQDRLGDLKFRIWGSKIWKQDLMFMYGITDFSGRLQYLPLTISRSENLMSNQEKDFVNALVASQRPARTSRQTRRRRNR